MNNFKLYIISLAGVSFFCFSLLVVCDYIVARIFAARATASNSETEIILSERMETQDVVYRSEARQNGYQPHFFPQLVDWDDRFKLLAAQHGVAPLSPQPNTDLYFCNEGYGLITYRSDRYGFRNSDEVWDTSIELVLVGDSFVHGACVEQENTISGLLEEKITTLNLGTDANSPVHYAAIVQQYIPHLSPKYVAMFFYANDNNTQSEYYHDFYFSTRADTPTISSLLLDESLDTFYQAAEDLLNAHVTNTPDAGYITYPSIWDRFISHLQLANIRSAVSELIYHNYILDPNSRLALRTLVDHCIEPDCMPIVVFLPNSDRWYPDPRSVRYEQLLQDEASRLHINFLSLSSVFEENKDVELFAPLGSHYSLDGYSLVATEIIDFIQ